MPLTFPILSSGSMKVYGTLANNAIMKYPSTLEYSYVTRILQFVGDQEQRFLVRGELFGALLQFRDVNGYDMSIVRDFFRSMRGMAASVDLTHTFGIVIDGVTYNYCVFDQDDISPEISRAELFSFDLKIKQLRPN